MRARRMMLVSAAVAHAACGIAPITYVYDVSVPQLISEKVAREVPKDGRLAVRLPRVKLTVSGLDGVSADSRCPYCFHGRPEATDDALPPLALLLDFTARSQAVSFRPMQVAVRSAEHGLRHPTAYYGPGKLWSESAWNSLSGASERRCEVAVGFLRERAYLQQRSDDVAHALPASSRCFVLVFDTTVSADTPAELLLDGLSDSAGAVVVPSIQLRRSQVRSANLNIWPPYR
jgi:hypothetical protein